MEAFTVTSDLGVTIQVEGKAKAKALWAAVDYALNNNSGISADDVSDLNSLRAELAVITV